MSALQAFFDKSIKLPSPPAIAVKILTAIRKDDNSFDKLAEIIMADPALTAQVLKIANSSLYGLSKKVNSLSQATALIGTQTLKNIALSFVIIENFQDIPQAGFNLDLFWRRAVSTAVSAEILAGQLGHKDQDIFVSGLLQDIGVLIMFLSNTTSFTEVLDTKRISGQSLSEVERNRFGFDHAEVGSHLLETWNLPDSIYGPIRRHHSRDPEEPYRVTARILCLADKISSIYHGTQSNRKCIEVHQDLADQYQFHDEMIDDMIDSIGEKAREMLDLFSLDPGDMKPFSLIMQEANEELRRLNFSYEQVVLELKQAKRSAEQLAVELKQANDRLRELAFRDDLTGLYNHRYFQEVLESELERSARYQHPLSLLMVDIDFFKRINDTYGHVTGDIVLKQVGNVMIQLVRHCDIVARYGGEEFAIILPEIGTAGAKVLAQRVRRGIEQNTIIQDNQEITVTVSIGLASTDMTGLDEFRSRLIEGSDQALYAAKRNGRNRVEPWG